MIGGVADQAVQFPVAELEGRCVWAADLHDAGERPEGLRCLGCGGRVHLRAGSLTPHFAHTSGAVCSAPESALHRAAKLLVWQSINVEHDRGGEYWVAWLCPGCDDDRPLNLAAGRAELEKRVGPVQPDVSVWRDPGELRCVVEIVVTHEPEPEALDWYRASGVGVIVVRPSWESLEELAVGLGRVETVGMGCHAWRHTDPHPGPCGECGEPVRTLRLEPAEGALCNRNSCQRAGRLVPVVDVLEVTDGGERHWPASEFPIAGIERFGRALGVRLRTATSTIDERGSYLMHHCSCGYKQGDFYAYRESHGHELRVGADVLHVTVCANGHWAELRRTKVPRDEDGDAPRRRAPGLPQMLGRVMGLGAWGYGSYQ